MSREQDPSTEAASAARNVVVWAALALACALLLAGWWASRTLSRTRALPADPAQPAALSSQAADPLSQAAGSVQVRVVDARDGTPLEGIEVELLCEEPVPRRFGRRSSDSAGAVRFEDVFAPLALACTRRSEGFAAAAACVRGSIDGPREVLLRLSEGGELRGRVVDDLGAPVAGARLCLPDVSPWPDPMQPAPLAALSDAKGEYRIGRVIDLPRHVTATESSIYAAAMSQVVVEASSQGAVARAPTSVRGCEVAFAADLVLPRPPVLRGRVLDARG